MVSFVHPDVTGSLESPRGQHWPRARWRDRAVRGPCRRAAAGRSRPRPRHGPGAGLSQCPRSATAGPRHGCPRSGSQAPGKRITEPTPTERVTASTGQPQQSLPLRCRSRGGPAAGGTPSAHAGGCRCDTCPHRVCRVGARVDTGKREATEQRHETRSPHAALCASPPEPGGPRTACESTQPFPNPGLGFLCSFLTKSGR